MVKAKPILYIGSEDATAALWKLTNNYLRTLHIARIRNRSLVALSLRTPLDFIAAYEACLRYDVVPLIIGELPSAVQVALQAGAQYLLRQREQEEATLLVINSAIDAVPEDVELICQTSGSLAEPKFVMWTEAAIRHQALSTAQRLGYGEETKLVLNASPWGAYGMSNLAIWNETGLALVLPQRSSPEYLFSIFHDTKASAFESIPAVYRNMINWSHKRNVRAKFSTVRVWGCGGDLLPTQLITHWMDLTGRPILDGYGLAEAGPNVAINTNDDWRLGTVGRPLPGVRLQINGGELLIKSPSLMKGYWRYTKHPFTQSGWLKTGDMAEIDSDGYLKILGRVRNVIIVRGRNVIPESVEQVLQSHSSISEAAVVNISLEPTAGRLAALLVPSNNGPLDVHDIKAFVAQHLEPHHVPRRYIIVSDLPKTNTGKLARDRLNVLVRNSGLLKEGSVRA